MANHVIALTKNEEDILTAISVKTGRTIDVLLANYIHGFISSLEVEAMKSQYEEIFSSLPFADQEKALTSIKAISDKI